MAIQSFRDLRVWQMGMDLVERIYQVTKAFPKEEMYGLTNQMRRAAVSIPSNVAEGHVREHLKEYLQHISMAQGSLAELQTQCEIAARLRYLAGSESREILELASTLAKHLYALRNALSAKAKAVGASPQHPTPNT